MILGTQQIEFKRLVIDACKLAILLWKQPTRSTTQNMCYFKTFMAIF